MQRRRSAGEAPDAQTTTDPHSPPARVGPRDSRARVVVVDDHLGVRAALARMLSDIDDIVLVGVAGNGEQGILLCRDIRPDVVLMDISMPVVGGIEATRRITAERPQTRVVILTASPGDQSAHARSAGATAYVPKHASNEAIIGAIRAAAAMPSPAPPRAMAYRALST